MKWKTAIQIGEYITARQSLKTGVWHLTHPDAEGKTVSYSTGIKGPAKMIRKWIKEEKIQDLVEVGMRTRLTRTVINQLTPRKKGWEALTKEYKYSMERMGRSPRTISRNLEHLDRFLREMDLKRRKPHTVSEEDVYEWVNNRISCKLQTRRIMLQAIRSAWNYFVGMGYADRNVAELTGIRMDKLSLKEKETKTIEAFNRTEFNRLISALDREIEDQVTRLESRRKSYQSKKNSGSGYSAIMERTLNRLKFLRSASYLAFGVGLRRSDVALLEWDSLNLMPGWLIVHTEKTNSRVAVPYSDDAIKEFLEEVPEEEKEAVRVGLEDSATYIRNGVGLIDESDIDFHYVYPRWAGTYHKNPATISVYFKRIVDAHNMNGKSFHGLRHGRIRIWKKQGLSLEQIGRFVGHANTRTTEGYLG